MASTAAPILLSWEVDPALLTDTVGSELHVDINADSQLVQTCSTALRGVQPAGVAGIKRFKYCLLMLLAAPTPTMACTHGEITPSPDTAIGMTGHAHARRARPATDASARAGAHVACSTPPAVLASGPAD